MSQGKWIRKDTCVKHNIAMVKRTNGVQPTSGKVRYYRYCAVCANERAKARYKNDHRPQMLRNARGRALKRGVPFTITKNDIMVPEFCPVLGIRLESRRLGSRGFISTSPSLDCVIPELGYVPGNVAVISWRANRLKADASLEELKKVVTWLSDFLNGGGDIQVRLDKGDKGSRVEERDKEPTSNA